MFECISVSCQKVMSVFCIWYVRPPSSETIILHTRIWMVRLLDAVGNIVNNFNCTTIYIIIVIICVVTIISDILVVAAFLAGRITWRLISRACKITFNRNCHCTCWADTVSYWWILTSTYRIGHSILDNCWFIVVVTCSDSSSSMLL